MNKIEKLITEKNSLEISLKVLDGGEGSGNFGHGGRPGKVGGSSSSNVSKIDVNQAKQFMSDFGISNKDLMSKYSLYPNELADRVNKQIEKGFSIFKSSEDFERAKQRIEDGSLDEKEKTKLQKAINRQNLVNDIVNKLEEKDTEVKKEEPKKEEPKEEPKKEEPKEESKKDNTSEIDQKWEIMKDRKMSTFKNKIKEYDRILRDDKDTADFRKQILFEMFVPYVDDIMDSTDLEKRREAALEKEKVLFAEMVKNPRVNLLSKITDKQRQDIKDEIKALNTERLEAIKDMRNEDLVYPEKKANEYLTKLDKLGLTEFSTRDETEYALVKRLLSEPAKKSKPKKEAPKKELSVYEILPDDELNKMYRDIHNNLEHVLNIKRNRNKSAFYQDMFKDHMKEYGITESSSKKQIEKAVRKKWENAYLKSYNAKHNGW